jgi:hypothetical protein
MKTELPNLVLIYIYIYWEDMKEHKQDRYHSAQDQNMPVTFWCKASTIDLTHIWGDGEDASIQTEYLEK